MTLSCATATASLGVYVVGALDHAERADVESHLATCPACRDELADLAPLPGLMSRLHVEEVLAGPPPVDDAMLERLLVAATRQRRGESKHRWLAAAAAVAVLALGTSGGAAAWRAAHATHWKSLAAANGPVHLSVKLAAADGGTRLEMAMRGVDRDERCSLIAVSRTGRTEVAGWWEAYTGTAHVTATTSIVPADLRELKVVTDDGRTLVTVRV